MSTSKSTSMPANLISNMKGIAYSPAPSDDAGAPPTKYFDTDFCNSSFPGLWSTENSGRGDIANLAAIGVNFIHLYNWSVPPAPVNGQAGTPGPYQRNHVPFLKECKKHNIGVFVPVSNYFLEQIHQGNGTTISSDIKAMVAEFYLVDGMQNCMWGIGNEYDLAGSLFSVNDVVTAMEYLVDAENALGISTDNLLPVTSPVSFAVGSISNLPAIDAINALKTAVEGSSKLGSTFWTKRFVASMNPFNGGTFLSNYISNTFPGEFPDLPFFFAEMGTPIVSGSAVSSEAEQATYYADQLTNTTPQANFIGRCVFQFLDQTSMKTGSEATFGITKFAGTHTDAQIQPAGYTPGGGENYRIDALTQKANYASVKTAYSS